MAIDASLWPETQSETSTRAELIDALVISTDDALLIELGPLLGERYRVHTVDTSEHFGAHFGEYIGEHMAGAWIGIFDVDSHAAARSALSRLEVQYPRCPLIVITARPEQWRASIGCGTVLAASAREPLAPAPLSQALQSAADRILAQGDEPPDALGPAAAAEQLEMERPRRGAVWAGAAVVLMVLAANAAWLHHRFALRGPAAAGSSTATHPPVASARAVSADSASAALASPAGRPQRVLELLSAARIAFRDQNLLPARLDGQARAPSALELYAQLLRQDPQDDEAQEGVRRLLVVGRSRIMADAVDGSLDDAERLLSLFQAAGVDAGEVRQLAGVVDAARPKGLTQRAAHDIAAGDFASADQLMADALASGADAASIQTLRTQESSKKLELQLSAMSKQMHAALQAGALDNAGVRLGAMRSVARNHPITLQAEQELQAALVQAAEQATRAAQFDLAQRDLSAAGELVGSAPLAEARGQLQEAKAAAALATAFRAPLLPATQKIAARLPPAAARAAPMTALASAAAPRPYVIARPRGLLPATYPSNAEVSGSVIVEFTLSAKGLASDVTVVQSDPPGVFDRAAVSAVQRGRYSTDALADGQAARARIKLRFDRPDRWPHP